MHITQRVRKLRKDGGQGPLAEPPHPKAAAARQVQGQGPLAPDPLPPAMPLLVSHEADADTDHDPYGFGLKYRDLISIFVGEHRDKIPKKGEGRNPFNALIARPVGSSERQSDPRAKAAMDKEWQTLRDKDVWDETDVREWDAVAEEAVANGEKHFSWLFWNMRGKESRTRH